MFEAGFNDSIKVEVDRRAAADQAVERMAEAVDRPALHRRHQAVGHGVSVIEAAGGWA